METSVDPAISVVMAVWNCQHYVEQSVRSILDQSFTNFEFIIIDDGSTDGSYDILAKLAEADHRIRLISRENRGLTFSLNEGLKLSRASLVARMDCDDIATRNRFALQVAEFARRPDLILLGGQALLIDVHNTPVRTLRLPIGSEQTQKALLESCPFVHPSVMFRREPAQKKLGYREKFRHAEDYDFWLRLSLQGEIDNLPETILKYRHHGTSITDRFSEAQAISTALALETFYADTRDQPTSLEIFSEPPIDFKSAINLCKNRDSRIRFTLTYFRSLVFSGAIKHDSLANSLFTYFNSLQKEQFEAGQWRHIANLAVRALMQYLRFGRYRNALRTVWWSLKSMPVCFTRAFLNAALNRIF